MDIQPTEKKSNLVKNILLIAGVIVILAVITLEVRAVTLPENRTLRRVNLGNRYLSELKYEEAIAEYDLAIAIDPKNVDAYLGKAEAYVQMDDIDSAIETLAEGYDETDDDEIWEEWLDLQMDLARKCLEEEDYEQAVTEFDNVLDIDDGYVEAYLWKAEAQENLGDTDAAIETLQDGYDRTGDARLQRAMEALGAQPQDADGTDAQAQESREQGEAEDQAQDTDETDAQAQESGEQEEAEDQQQDAVDEDEVIVWHDAEFERWTRETLGIPEGDIRRRDVQGITEMEIRGPYFDNTDGYEVQSIEDLAYFTNLTSLKIRNCDISDISALSDQTNLTSLDISNDQYEGHPYSTNISDISVLHDLTNLEDLNLTGNNISNINALSGLTNLEYLYLADNNISDVSALSGLTNLGILDLDYNNISDVSALSDLTNLAVLWLSGNQISDVGPLSSLTNLEELWLTGNPVEDLAPVSFVNDIYF